MSQWKPRAIAVAAALVVIVSLPSLGGFAGAGFGNGHGAPGATGWTWR